MDFENRLKKELTEGVIRAILIDSRYRLIDTGIENIIREVTCLTALEYSGLDIPKAISSMPDFIVLDKEQKNKYLVEVKYRSKWDSSIFNEIKEQVTIFNELILVYFNSKPPASEKEPTPGAYIRCCKVRNVNGEIQAELKSSKGNLYWLPTDKIHNESTAWWSLQLMQDTFPMVNDRKSKGTLMKAISSLQGIINT